MLNWENVISSLMLFCDKTTWIGIPFYKSIVGIMAVILTLCLIPMERLLEYLFVNRLDREDLGSSISFCVGVISAVIVAIYSSNLPVVFVGVCAHLLFGNWFLHRAPTDLTIWSLIIKGMYLALLLSCFFNDDLAVVQHHIMILNILFATIPVGLLLLFFAVMSRSEK